jgi:hypothetical protein
MVARLSQLKKGLILLLCLGHNSNIYIVIDR